MPSGWEATVSGSSKGRRSYIFPPGTWHGSQRCARTGCTSRAKSGGTSVWSADTGSAGAAGRGVDEALAERSGTSAAGSRGEGAGAHAIEPEAAAAAKATPMRITSSMEMLGVVRRSGKQNLVNGCEFEGQSNGVHVPQATGAGL